MVFQVVQAVAVDIMAQVVLELLVKVMTVVLEQVMPLNITGEVVVALVVWVLLVARALVLVESA